MKTKLFSILSLIFCTAVIFVTIVPYEYALISFEGFIQSGDFAKKAWTVTIISALLILVCAIGIHKLLNTRDALLEFCAILIICDPLLKCSMLNLKFGCIMLVTVLLCLYFSYGKSLVIKTELMAAFSFVSVMLYTDSAFSHVPIAAMVYGFAYLSAKNADDLSDKDKKIIGLPKTQIIPALAAPFLIAFLLKMVFADTLFTQNIVFRFASIENLYNSGRLLIAVVPGVCLLALLMKKQFASKPEAEQTTSGNASKNLPMLLTVLAPVAMVLVGIFAFDSYPAATVINMVIITAVVMLYQYCTKTASEPSEKLLSVFGKRKFIWCILFLAWLITTSYLFKGSSTSILDNLAFFSGGRL